VAAVRTRSTWRWILLLTLAVFGLGQISYWAVVAEDIEKPLDPVCADWDCEASVGIALLVPVSTPLAESHLDDALFRLRRAQELPRRLARHCAAGLRASARALSVPEPAARRPLRPAGGTLTLQHSRTD